MTAKLSSVLCLCIGACVPAKGSVEFAEPNRTLPRVEGTEQPSEVPSELPGIRVDDLSERVRNNWWRLVSQLYAPCTEQAVSLAQCVVDKRPCNACVPMAEFLADRFKKGDTSVDAEAAAAIRFGPDVRTVDLADSPGRGPNDALLTIVAWSDFECPSCGRTVPLLHQFQASHPNEVRFVHKFYPLDKHTNAKRAARAAFAAGKQGKFWEMEEALFRYQENLSASEIDRLAKELSLDLKKFAADAESRSAGDAIARDVDQAEQLGLRATPFIIVNGRPFDFKYFKPADLENWLATERELRKPKSN